MESYAPPQHRLTSSGISLPSSKLCRMDMHCALVSKDPLFASTTMGCTAPDAIMAFVRGVGDDKAWAKVVKRVCGGGKIHAYLTKIGAGQEESESLSDMLHNNSRSSKPR